MVLCFGRLLCPINCARNRYTDYYDAEGTVKEKRVVSYNPSLAAKQKAEIMKMADIVSSETEMTPADIYSTYHNLWKIEESFRITKSYLDARPVFVQKKETIYGHFLICYLSLFLLRVLEIKCFKNEVSAYDIIEFIRDFRIVDKGDDTYINISHNQKIIDALVLTKNEIDSLFNKTILIDS